MSKTENSTRRFAVIGGGISGLVAARRLVQKFPQAKVKLYESASRVGGVLYTVQYGDFLVEHSADMMATNPPHAINLVKELGLEQDLMPTNAAERKAFVAFQGKLHRVPEGFSLMAPTKLWPIFTNRLLTWRGKWRLMREAKVARRTDTSDESLEDFAIRRFGQEAYERLIQPLVSGIYTADPKKLSMQATSLSRFVAMEQQYGSLAAAMMSPKARKTEKSDNEASGARYGMFVGLKNGAQSLIDALERSLPSDTIQRANEVTKLQRDDSKSVWVVSTQTGVEEFDDVIVTVPAKQAASIVRTVDQDLHDSLARIEHASVAVVVLGFRPEAISKLPEGFGLVVPIVEKSDVIAISFSSNKFPGRVPAGGLLTRTFFGGALRPEMMNKSDAELIRLARKELQKWNGLTAEPSLSQVVRWNQIMPQYHVGHLELVKKIKDRVAAIPNFYLIGKGLEGVGIPDVVHAANECVKQID